MLTQHTPAFLSGFLVVFQECNALQGFQCPGHFKDLLVCVQLCVCMCVQVCVCVCERVLFLHASSSHSRFIIKRGIVVQSP